VIGGQRRLLAQVREPVAAVDDARRYDAPTARMRLRYHRPMPATPFELLGGAPRVRALVETFYDWMGAHEPALAKLHRQDADGRVDRGSRDRFALFLIGWLGGPDDYVQQFGHPRLRMRHARVAVDVAMRDAWLRSMTAALDALAITGEVRTFLNGRFTDVADFMRNAG
jgi:hemoglobin